MVVVGSADRMAPLLRSYDADVGLCGGWGWKLGPDALSATRLGIVNGHPSLLPRWRGPNPFGWTLRAGDPVVGFTYHFMDEGFDTGPLLAQGSRPLSDEDTMRTLMERTRELADELLPQALARAEAGDPRRSAARGGRDARARLRGRVRGDRLDAARARGAQPDPLVVHAVGLRASWAR